MEKYYEQDYPKISKFLIDRKRERERESNLKGRYFKSILYIINYNYFLPKIDSNRWIDR